MCIFVVFVVVCGCCDEFMWDGVCVVLVVCMEGVV